MNKNIREYIEQKAKEPLVGLIFVGSSNDKIANELEADALKYGFEITDTIMNEEKPFEMLIWYLRNSSVMAVLVRDISDISQDTQVLQDVFIEAARQGVGIYSKAIGWNAVKGDY